MDRTYFGRVFRGYLRACFTVIIFNLVWSEQVVVNDPFDVLDAPVEFFGDFFFFDPIIIHNTAFSAWTRSKDAFRQLWLLGPSRIPTLDAFGHIRNEIGEAKNIRLWTLIASLRLNKRRDCMLSRFRLRLSVLMIVHVDRRFRFLKLV